MVDIYLKTYYLNDTNKNEDGILTG